MTIELQGRQMTHNQHDLPPISEGVAERLSQVAVLHEIDIDEASRRLTAGIPHQGFTFHDLSTRSNIRRTGASDQRGLFIPEKAIHDEAQLEVKRSYFKPSPEKTRALHAIRAVVTPEATNSEDEHGVDWTLAALRLLERAREAAPEEKTDLLVGAVTCSQFASSMTDRVEFIEAVYGLGIEAEVAEACEKSPIVIMAEGPHASFKRPDVKYTATMVHQVKTYASVFRISGTHMERYLKHTPRVDTADEGLPSTKGMQKEFLASQEKGEAPEGVTAKAQEVSVHGEKVGGVLLDINKMERFGLQQSFIREQMGFVLGPDLQHTPLAARLTQKRGELNVIAEDDVAAIPGVAMVGDLDKLVEQLGSDTSVSMTELSQAAIAKYSLEGADLHNIDALSDEQRAALRYRVVIHQMGQQRRLAEYLDFEEFVESNNREVVGDIAASTDEIWATSQDGAAAPMVMTDVIHNVVNGALANQELGQVSPEELRDFAHSNRRRLLTLATLNIADLNTELRSDTQLQRNEAGRLVMEGDFAMPDKEALDLYAAVALGCPALRERHPDRALLTMEQRAAVGSSNYVDHILAVIINEAYERGIFDLSRFRS
jgi:hypothetical protein